MRELLHLHLQDKQYRDMQRERLTERYMVECVSMELLRLAYEQAAEHIHERLGKWMSGFAFVGDQIPYEHMEEIFGYLGPQDVSYNEHICYARRKQWCFSPICVMRERTATVISVRTARI